MICRRLIFRLGTRMKRRDRAIVFDLLVKNTCTSKNDGRTDGRTDVNSRRREKARTRYVASYGLELCCGQSSAGTFELPIAASFNDRRVASSATDVREAFPGQVIPDDSYSSLSSSGSKH